MALGPQATKSSLSGRLADMTCIVSRNASCPAPIFTAITSNSRSRLSWPAHRHADDGPGCCYCLVLPSSASPESATAIAKRRALGMFPPAETTRAVPATEIITPWMSSAVTALAAVASAFRDGCLGSHGALPGYCGMRGCWPRWIYQYYTAAPGRWHHPPWVSRARHRARPSAISDSRS